MNTNNPLSNASRQAHELREEWRRGNIGTPVRRTDPDYELTRRLIAQLTEEADRVLEAARAIARQEQARKTLDRLVTCRLNPVDNPRPGGHFSTPSGGHFSTPWVRVPGGHLSTP